ADRNRSHWSTSKTPSYTKSVSWQHHPITEEEYIGSMALITGHQATSGNPCEGKLTDQFGQIHYLLLEPEEGKIFTKGDKVLIICRLSATRYLAENNPWPQIL
ncbi:YqiJ family protein, partial [Escherichia coli]|uniref:YqiJ family protein n=1 Tax=Escherichia coli TaxID=562 RepID=UPI0021D4A363